MRSLTHTPLICVLAAFAVVAPNALSQDDGARKADHEELRALKDAFAAAINARDFESARPLLSESFTFTTIANQRLVGVDEMKAYWDKMFVGEKAVLDSMTVAPEADEETVFLSETVGVTQGESKDVYEFKSVGRRDLTSRWTAVVEKVDGKWKVARVHMSANVLDNAVLDGVAKIGTIKTAIGTGGGLIVGLILGRMLFGRKKVG